MPMMLTRSGYRNQLPESQRHLREAAEARIETVSASNCQKKAGKGRLDIWSHELTSWLCFSGGMTP